MPAPKKGKRFGKSASHQKLMLANLAVHLIISEADAITTTVQNVTQQGPANPSASPKGATAASASASGQPAVVAARNSADKKLRDASQDDQRTLEKLRSTKVEGADRGKLRHRRRGQPRRRSRHSKLRRRHRHARHLPF